MDIFGKDLEINGFTLKNFINLGGEEKEMVRRWRNNENIRKWMYTDHLISREEHTNFINALKKDKKNIYFLVVKESKYIGVLNFNNIDFNHKRAYFGIYSNPEERILGAGRILINLVKELAFTILNLHTLRLEVIEHNTKALNLYKNSGFQEEGRLKDFVFKNGSWKDVIVMGIINPEEKNENSQL